MRISAKQQELDKLVRWADPFTEKGTSSTQHHLRCLYIVAEGDRVTVTAESNTTSSAISFASFGVDIEEEGSVLVQSSWLRTALSTIPADSRVTLELDGKQLNVRGARVDVDLAVSPLESGRVMVPRVGDYEKDSGMTLEGTEFVRGFTIGSPAHDVMRRSPVLQAVHLSVVEGNGARFLSTDKQVSTYVVTPTTEVADEDLVLLLLPSGTQSVLEYIRLGKTVEILPGTSPNGGDPTSVHYLVYAEDGSRLFHLRVPTLAASPSEYPAAQLLGLLKNLLSGDNVLQLDKADLLRLLHNADRMSGLNPADSDGQAKRMGIRVSNEEVEVGITGAATYSDIADVASWNGPEMELQLKWGLHGKLIEEYPGRDTMKIAVLERSGKPVALALHTAESGWSPADGDLPTDYISIVPVTDAKYLS